MPNNCFILFVCLFVFFYLGFLSQTFTNHRTAGEGVGHFCISSLPIPPASQTLRYWLTLKLTDVLNFQYDFSRKFAKQKHLLTC